MLGVMPYTAHNKGNKMYILMYAGGCNKMDWQIKGFCKINSLYIIYIIYI